MLVSRTVHAAITRFGAMLAPVRFHADSAVIEPYSLAPWATEELPADTHPLLRALRGDFMCSAFGDNSEPLDGRSIPPHGDTVNGNWTCLYHREAAARGTALRLAIDMRNQGGRCTSSTMLLDGHSFVYQRHDFEGVSGPINPGHHAMLQCPPARGSAQISVSRHVFACAQPPRGTLPTTHLRSTLAPGLASAQLTSMPCTDGTTTDVTSFPSADGVDDVLMVCADPAHPLAWSAATFRESGYAWLSLRNRAQLPSTLVWLSNGGMLQPPWNGRHRNVLALEDVMGYFAAGIAPSAKLNRINARGIPTSVWARPEVPLRIPYIQGVVRLPPNFSRVADVTPCGPGRVQLQDDLGVSVEVACEWEFLASGHITGLCED